METTFTDRLVDAMRAKKSILCGGLDPQLRFMPPHLVDHYRLHYGDTFEAVGRLYICFNREIIDAVAPFAAAVKPQMAFYEMYGHWGVWAFERTVDYAMSKGLLVIGDAKRGDGGDTAEAYAQGYVGRTPFFGKIEEGMIRAVWLQFPFIRRRIWKCRKAGILKNKTGKYDIPWYGRRWRRYKGKPERDHGKSPWVASLKWSRAIRVLTDVKAETVGDKQ